MREVQRARYGVQAPDEARRSVRVRGGGASVQRAHAGIRQTGASHRGARIARAVGEGPRAEGWEIRRR